MSEQKEKLFRELKYNIQNSLKIWSELRMVRLYFDIVLVHELNVTGAENVVSVINNFLENM